MKTKDDSILIEHIKSGDESAFRSLVEKHQKKIYYLALDLIGNHDDAEDLAQEVFIKAYHKLHTYRMEAKVSSWLYRITVNAYIDKHRVKRWRMIKPIQSGDENTDLDVFAHDVAASDTERKAASALLQQHIQSALKKLSGREKAVFVLKHYHDLPIKEIARAKKISEGTVKSLLFRAVKKMQTALAPVKNELGLEDLL